MGYVWVNDVVRALHDQHFGQTRGSVDFRDLCDEGTKRLPQSTNQESPTTKFTVKSIGEQPTVWVGTAGGTV